VQTELIDNALEEVANLDAKNRIVHLEFDEDRIEIRNKISVRAGKDGPDNPLHMFEPGYSSKGADRGFGLSNVLSAAERYGIKVHNELRDDYVIFRLNFTKD
jgi:sensor histidine kinase regulating citrate/malate metabolism